MLRCFHTLRDRSARRSVSPSVLFAPWKIKASSLRLRRGDVPGSHPGFVYNHSHQMSVVRFIHDATQSNNISANEARAMCKPRLTCIRVPRILTDFLMHILTGKSASCALALEMRECT